MWAEYGRKPGLERFGKAMESFPLPVWTSSPWTRLDRCFSNLFFSAVMESPRIPFAYYFSFPTNRLSKTQRYSFLKNINISHCSWIHVCFAQPTAGEESSPTSSQKCPFSLLELGLTKSLTVLSIFPDFHQRKRKKENFGGWHMGTILPFLQEGPRPA